MQGQSQRVGGLYESLNPSRNQIRLVRFLSIETLHSHDIPASIHLELETVSLDENPSYVALSYECNARVDCALVPVTLNGITVPVKDNLLTCLLSMRFSLSDCNFFWVDALCVNNEDLTERNQQVLLMTRIFREASVVQIWLGHPSIDSDIAMIFLNATENLLKNESGTFSVDKWCSEKWNDPELKETWISILNLCKRSYWRRRWIIQESLANSRPILFCGLKSVKLHALFRIVHQTVKSFHDMTFASESLEWQFSTAALFLLSLMRAAPDFILSKPQYNLLEALWSFRQFECFDPHDRIYSLIGLTTTYQHGELYVSYDAHVFDVYKKAARHTIEGSRELQVLRYCHKNGEGVGKLPSWVPDWTCMQSELITTHKYNGWKAAQDSPNTPIEFLENDTILRTKARLVTSIESIKHVTEKTVSSKKGRLAQLVCWWNYAMCDPAPPFHDDVSKRHAWKEIFNRSHSCYEALFFTLEDRKNVIPYFDFMKFGDFVLGKSTEEDMTPEQDHLVLRAVLPFRSLFKSCLPENIACTYDRKVLGLCYRESQCGDQIAVIDGCRYPLILREIKDKSFTVVGEAYVQGLMKGEALNEIVETTIDLY